MSLSIGDKVKFLWSGSWQDATIISIDDPVKDDYPYQIETEINGEMSTLWSEKKSLRKEELIEITQNQFSPRCPLCGSFGEIGAWSFYCSNKGCKNYQE